LIVYINFSFRVQRKRSVEVLGTNQEVLLLFPLGARAMPGGARLTEPMLEHGEVLVKARKRSIFPSEASVTNEMAIRLFLAIA